MTEQNPLLEVASIPKFEKINASYIDEAIDTSISNSEKILEKVEAETNINWESIMVPMEEISRMLGSSWGYISSSFCKKFG